MGYRGFFTEKVVYQKPFFFISWFSSWKFQLEIRDFLRKNSVFYLGKSFLPGISRFFRFLHGYLCSVGVFGIFHSELRVFLDLEMLFPVIRFFHFRIFYMISRGFRNFSTRFFPIFFYYKTAKFFCITIVTFGIFNFQKFQFYRF